MKRPSDRLSTNRFFRQLPEQITKNVRGQMERWRQDFAQYRRPGESTAQALSRLKEGMAVAQGGKPTGRIGPKRARRPDAKLTRDLSRMLDRLVAKRYGPRRRRGPTIH